VSSKDEIIEKLNIELKNLLSNITNEVQDLEDSYVSKYFNQKLNHNNTSEMITFKTYLKLFKNVSFNDLIYTLEEIINLGEIDTDERISSIKSDYMKILFNYKLLILKNDRTVTLTDEGKNVYKLAMDIIK
jgi:hypothetical protein